MIKNIDHIGVAVQNLDKSIKKWCDFFNLPQPQKEKMEERGVEVAALHTGKGPSVELIEGEGIHHFCFLVENLEESVRELKAKGVSFIHPEPVKGAHGSRIIFIHPEIFNGVLIELKEKGSRSFDYSVY